MSNLIELIEGYEQEPWYFLIDEWDKGRIQTYAEDPRVISATRESSARLGWQVACVDRIRPDEWHWAVDGTNGMLITGIAASLSEGMVAVSAYVTRIYRGISIPEAA